MKAALLLDWLDQADFTEQHLRPLLAIKANCLFCSVTWKQVQNCDITRCPLHPYRLGRRQSKHSKLIRWSQIAKEKPPKKVQTKEEEELHEKYAKI